MWENAKSFSLGSRAIRVGVYTGTLCNGSTRDFDSLSVGSTPTAPAITPPVVHQAKSKPQTMRLINHVGGLIMKNIVEICKDFGFEIPADKVADFNKAVAENYKTIAEHDKKVGKIEAERDAFKGRAETAEDTLRGFEGKDFDGITKDRDEWKKKAEQFEQDYNNKMAAHEKNELLKEAFADIEFTSESAKRAVYARVEKETSVINSQLRGFHEAIEAARKDDAAAFVDKQQQELNNNRAQFATPKNNNNSNSGDITKDTIRAIKDPAERQKKIAENIHLFQKG